jgi:FtsZ-binding cell division protein ZapB
LKLNLDDVTLTSKTGSSWRMHATGKKKHLAEESAKTRKAREKLRRHLDEVARKITPQALEKKSIEIHRWIARHAPHRVVLKNKDISLFDENQNAARLSHRVAALAETLKGEITPPSHNFWKTRNGAKRVTQKPAVS